MVKSSKLEKTLNWGKKALVGGGIVLGSIFGGNYAKGQEPEEAYEYVSYPFSRPTTSQPTGPYEELNWYGSGDVNRDEGESDIINQNDISRLGEIINGSYTNPNDRKLNDRGDINGDGVVNSADKTILQEYVNGTRTYLTGDWNKMQTEGEKRDWLQKMINIAQLNKTCDGIPPSQCDCKQYADKTILLMQKGSERDWEVFVNSNPINYIYEEFKEDYGRFNLPVNVMEIQDYNPDGTIFGGHVMNCIAKGEDALDWNQNFKIEPQGNAIIEIGEWYLGTVTDSSLIRNRGYPTTKDEMNLYTNLGVYSFLYVSNKIPARAINAHKEYPNNPNAIPYIDKKDHDAPEMTVNSPIQGGLYSSGLELEVNINDATIFDRFRYINPVYNEDNELISHNGKEYYNNHIWASLDNGLNWKSLLKYTDKNIETILGKTLDEGDYTIKIIAKDMQGNQTEKSLSFSIDLTPPVVTITKPLEGILYEGNVKGVFSVSDENINPDSIYYTINNGSKNHFNGNFNEDLNLGEGYWKADVVGVDLSGNKTQKEVNFAVANKPKVTLDYLVDKNNISTTWDIDEENFNPENSYISLNGNKENISQSGSKEYNNLQNGDYRLVVKGEDEFGLADSTVANINITGVGLENKVSENQLKVYPNPVKDIGVIGTPKGKDLYLEFYDISGRLNKEIIDNDKDGITEVDFSDLNPGMYIIRASDENKKPIGTTKVVKE